MSAGFDSNLTGYWVHTALPSTWLGPENMGELHLYFHPTTKKLTGIGRFRTGKAVVPLNIDSAVGENKSDDLMPLSEEAVNLIEKFVHDLCSIQLFSQQAASGAARP